ncbi:MAG: VCBS repeat-containing protein [Acidobacteria bacterium]|nr:VCBS repeat-containing protein [Acidobacteriota bacterium]
MNLVGRFAGVACIVAFGCVPPAGAGEGALALSYVESSQGLEPPAFEGGNSEFEMADIDGDGNVDLVSLGDHGNPLINSTQEGVLVWLGDGRGAWTYRHFGHLGYGGVGVGDLDGDGTLDIAYGVHHDYGSGDLGDQILEAALGDGTGSVWVPWDDGLAAHGEYYGMFTTDLADVEADGDLDIASMGFGSTSGLQVYLNRGTGSWERSFGYLEGNSGHELQFGEVNGDGAPDFGTSKQEATVWLGDGEGFFSPADANLPPVPEFQYRDGASLGDIDGDGRDDLAFCNASGNAEAWLQRGAAWESASAGLPADARCEHTQLHDMDGDGLVDLVTFGVRRVRVFAGNGGTAWTLAAEFDTPDQPGNSQAFRVGGDVDHNGRADMVLLDERRISSWTYVNKMHVYRESSTPSALSARIVQPGPHRRWLAGSVAFVDWAAAVPGTLAATATLEFSAAGVAGPWSTIAAGLPNNGRHQWRVPATTCGDCRIRVTVSTGVASASATSAAFTIARRPEKIDVRVDRAGVRWHDSLARELVQVYRGDWRHFRASGEYTQDPAAVPAAARFCNLPGAQDEQPDAFVPAPGELAFYLVTAIRMYEDNQDPGVAVPMAESPLGQRGDAAMRPNAHPCPAPVR